MRYVVIEDQTWGDVLIIRAKTRKEVWNLPHYIMCTTKKEVAKAAALKRVLDVQIATNKRFEENLKRLRK